MNLTEEEKEMVREMIELGQWAAVTKLVEKVVYNFEVRLLNANLADGKDEVFTRKAQYDAAKSVRSMFDTIRNDMRGRKK